MSGTPTLVKVPKGWAPHHVAQRAKGVCIQKSHRTVANKEAGINRLRSSMHSYTPKPRTCKKKKEKTKKNRQKRPSPSFSLAGS